MVTDKVYCDIYYFFSRYQSAISVSIISLVMFERFSVNGCLSYLASMISADAVMFSLSSFPKYILISLLLCRNGVTQWNIL